MSARKTKDGFPAKASVEIPAKDGGIYTAFVNQDEMQWEAWYADSKGEVDLETLTTPGYPTWQNAIAEVKQRRRSEHR